MGPEETPPPQPEARAPEEDAPLEPTEPPPDETPAPVPEVAPVPDAAPPPVPGDDGSARRGPGLGTRLVVLVVGLGLLAGVALIQRFAERERPLATTERRTTSPPHATARVAPTIVTPTPAPVPQKPGAPVVSAAACKSRTQRDLDRHYSFERSRLGLWFRRLERYNDHRLRIDGDRSGHAGRDALIGDSRRSRLGALEDKRTAAERACDPRLLA